MVATASTSLIHPKLAPRNFVASLAEAELAEDGVEQIFGGGFADNFADGIDSDVKVEGNEFEGSVRTQGVERKPGAFASAAQRVLMSRVDGDL